MLSKLLKIQFNINCSRDSQELCSAIALVSEDLGIESVSEGAEYAIEVKKSTEHILKVSVEGKNAAIEYGGGVSVFLRGLAIAADALRKGERAEIYDNPIFTLNGAMLDMSRNAVMKLDTVKFVMRKMALMGMNAFMLYTEDTYELEGYDYFGHMRGRYTREELVELDNYAKSLGLELIPCIQLLGHLGTHLRWNAATKYRDGTQTMLVGAEETYKIIDKMIRTVSECFSSKRIHVGMDETVDLGTGRSLHVNGYRPASQLYMEHLTRVCEIIKNYGLRPMMWSDMMMHFVSVGDVAGRHGYDITLEHSEEMKKYFPEDIDQVFWDYYNDTEEFYRKNIENHRKYLGNCTLFAGGVWTWSGFAPLYKRSLGFTLPALDVCREQGVKEVVATVWNDGAECNLILALAGLAWYADYTYKGYYDEESVKRCFSFATGENYDDFAMLERVEEPNGDLFALSRPLLYDDPLISLAGKNLESLDTADFYKDLSAELSSLKVADEYAPAFDVICKLSSLFENKADFSTRLKRAYDCADKKTLAKMQSECDLIIKKLNKLRIAHRESWMKYNKPFGWEVFDIRYGGLIMRFETCRERLQEYLSGNLDKIDELDASRLRIDCSENPNTLLTDHMLWRRYTSYITAGVL